MLRIAPKPIPAIAILAVALAACSETADPQMLEALTEGYWHGAIGDTDVVTVFRVAEGVASGESHQILGGRQRAVSQITELSLAGTTLEIRYAGIPPYRGVVDLEAGTITGGHPGAGAYEELNYARAEPADWPMVTPQPAAGGAEMTYVWSRPAERPDGWETATLQDVDIDPAAIERTMAAILAGEAGWMHSLLLVRRGKLVLEEYFHGWTADDLHRLASCTKSVASLLVGLAIDRGEIDGVHVPLLEFFPERRSGAGEGWEAITLEHLLTMSMGLDWTPLEAETFPPAGEDRLTNVISRRVATEPGTRFQYVSRNTNLLSMVLLQATGMHADAFAAEHLFGPLGIEAWNWDSNRQDGQPAMSGTLMLRPRDMAKLGRLVQQEGAWDGQQVVSAAWIRESTAPRFNPTDDDEYGYLWWGFDDPPPGVDFAMGLGSQYIVVAPALDLVLVATGANEYNDKQAAILNVVRQHLAPGLR